MKPRTALSVARAYDIASARHGVYTNHRRWRRRTEWLTDRLTASPPRPVPKVSRCESVRRVPRNSLATWTRILPSQGWILSIWIAVGKFDRSLRSIGKRVTELRRRSRSHRAKDPIERYLPSGRPRCTCSPVDPALVTQTCHLGHPRLGAPLLRTSPGCSSGRSPPRCSYLGPDRPKSRRSCRCNSDVSPRSPDTRCPVAPLRPVSRSRSWLGPLPPRGFDHPILKPARDGGSEFRTF